MILHLTLCDECVYFEVPVPYSIENEIFDLEENTVTHEDVPCVITELIYLENMTQEEVEEIRSLDDEDRDGDLYAMSLYDMKWWLEKEHNESFVLDVGYVKTVEELEEKLGRKLDSSLDKYEVSSSRYQRSTSGCGCFSKYCSGYTCTQTNWR